MSRPTDNQRKYACDIASKLSIPLPEFTFNAYNDFIRANRKAFQERLKIEKRESRRYVIPEVEPRFFVKQTGNIFSALPLTDIDNLKALLFPLIRTLPQEVVCVVSLDQYDSAISIAKVAMGEKGCEAVTQSLIFRTAVLQNAKSIILVLSHVDSDDDSPTEKEAALFFEACDAGEDLGITVKSLIVIDSYGAASFHPGEDFSELHRQRICEHDEHAKNLIEMRKQAAEKKASSAAKPAPKKPPSKKPKKPVGPE